MADLQRETDVPIREFMTGLASADSAQGAVSAAAVAGAMGTSLLLKVAALPTTRSGSSGERAALIGAATALGDLLLGVSQDADADTIRQPGRDTRVDDYLSRLPGPP